jgi:ATP synthase protein I
MTQDDFPQDESRPLTDLESRLRALRGRVERHDEAAGENAAVPRTATGFAFRVGVELVAALVVGGGLGWLLDYALGTGPLLLIVFFFLGAGAGILGVFRAAKQINAAEMQSGIGRR